MTGFASRYRFIEKPLPCGRGSENKLGRGRWARRELSEYQARSSIRQDSTKCKTPLVKAAPASAGYNKSSLAATAGRYRKVVNSVWQKSICRMAKPWKVLYGALNARFNKKT